MMSKLLASVLLLLLSPVSLMAQTSQALEETSHEIILPKHVQERLDFKKNVPNTLTDEVTAEDVLKAKTDYSYVDPNRVIPAKLREAALAYFDVNKKNFANQKYITVVDFSAHSSRARFFIVDMATGKVQALHVSHGKNSDTNNDGYAERFSNKSGSEASSVGFYRVSEPYNGSHGYSVRLDGLSSTNSNVRARAVVIHPADYVSEKKSKAGRSWGCLALDPLYSSKVISLLKNGSMLYANTSK